jgi:membrane protein required for colicin V production
METFDIIVCFVILLSGVIGLTRGITREALGLLSWFFASIASYVGFPFANKIALNYISNPNIAQYITYFAIFIGFLILFSIISNIISSLVKKTVLGGVDRTLGFAFGVTRSFVLLAAMSIILGFFFTENTVPAFFANSRSYMHINIFGAELFNILPEKVQNFIKEKSKPQEDIEKYHTKQKLTPSEEKEEQEKIAENLAQLKPQENPEEEKSLIDNMGKSIKDDALNHLIEAGEKSLDGILKEE